MIYSLNGRLTSKGDNFAIVETCGIGFKVFLPRLSLAKLSFGAEPIALFCYLHLREDGAELYGFLNEGDRSFFELLNSVNGVGPKTALAIMSVEKVESLTAAILENRPDLLTRTAGVGKKIAERVVL